MMQRERKVTLTPSREKNGCLSVKLESPSSFATWGVSGQGRRGKCVCVCVCVYVCACIAVWGSRVDESPKVSGHLWILFSHQSCHQGWSESRERMGLFLSPVTTLQGNDMSGLQGCLMVWLEKDKVDIQNDWLTDSERIFWIIWDGNSLAPFQMTSSSICKVVCICL